MLVGAGTKLNLFDLRRLLVTPALVIVLAEFKSVLTIVHDAANWRLRGRSHLNKVVAPLLGLVKGLYGRQYSQLLAFRTDDSNFPNPDFPVYT